MRHSTQVSEAFLLPSDYFDFFLLPLLLTDLFSKIVTGEQLSSDRRESIPF